MASAGPLAHGVHGQSPADAAIDDFTPWPNGQVCPSVLTAVGTSTFSVPISIGPEKIIRPGT